MSTPAPGPYNPLQAETDQDAATAAMVTVREVPLANLYYRHINESFARNLTILARDYKRHQGRDPSEATLADVHELVVDFEHLAKVVGASIKTVEGGKRLARVQADWLSPSVRDWLQQFYLPLQPYERQRAVSGVCAALDKVLFHPEQTRVM